jgi:hypothetical protein
VAVGRGECANRFGEIVPDAEIRCARRATDRAGFDSSSARDAGLRSRSPSNVTSSPAHSIRNENSYDTRSRCCGDAHPREKTQ